MSGEPVLVYAVYNKSRTERLLPVALARHHPLHIVGIQRAVGSTEEWQITIHLRSHKCVGVRTPIHPCEPIHTSTQQALCLNTNATATAIS
jgi:hypothetical protein